MTKPTKLLEFDPPTEPYSLVVETCGEITITVTPKLHNDLMQQLFKDFTENLNVNVEQRDRELYFEINSERLEAVVFPLEDILIRDLVESIETKSKRDAFIALFKKATASLEAIPDEGLDD